MITIKNEELAPEKQIFIILDKMADDLKKIYDNDDYEVYEEERINKAGEEMIKLGASHPMAKELVAYVSDKVYDREYEPEDLKDRIVYVIGKYKG